jgi:hypothetical protein
MAVLGFGNKNYGEIVSVFTKVKTDLQDLAERSDKTVVDITGQIADLNVKKGDAQLEGLKAVKTISKIDEFLNVDDIAIPATIMDIPND